MGYPDLPVFLGVGRFKGYWNANTNSGTLAQSHPGGTYSLTNVFLTGAVDKRHSSDSDIGDVHYDPSTALTASVGDFWKVTTAGTTSVDGEDTWRVSDFVVFTYNSGSTSGSVWQKLNYTDTVSSIIYGNGSGGSTVFGVSAADVHEFTGSLYVSGALYAEELNTTVHNHTVTTTHIAKSGSTAFGDSPGDQHIFSGSIYTGGNISVSGTWAENIASTHALTVHGDISGSGKILNVGGIETQGDLGVTGSATIRGALSASSIEAHHGTLNGEVTFTNERPIIFTSSAENGKFNFKLQNRNLEMRGYNAMGGALITMAKFHPGDGASLPKVQIGYDAAAPADPTHALSVYGDMSGSGKIFNLGGIETAENLGVSGSATIVKTLTLNAGGISPAIRLTSSAQNTDFYIIPAARGLWMYNRSGGALGYNLVMYDNKVQVGSVSLPTHTLTVAGDMSGSGKILNVGGIETEGDVEVTGSVGVRNNVVCLGTIYTIDMSGSGKILNVGGIETQGSLGVTGSAQISGTVAVGAPGAYVTASHPLSVFGDISGSGKIFNLGGIETAGMLGVSGTITTEGANATVAMRFTSSAANTDYRIYQTQRQLSFYNGNTSGYSLSFLDQKLSVGGQTPTHTLTVYGDVSGSGKVFSVAGIETQGNLGVTGSVTIRGTTSAAAIESTANSYFSSRLAVGTTTSTHTLTVSGDLSGSGKILNVGGIETQGSLGVTGSAQISGSVGIGAPGAYVSASHPLSVFGDMSGSGKIFNLGGIQTAGNLGVSGSVTIVGDISGSGKILNTGGIETQGELGVTGSIISRHNVISSGSMYSHESMYIQGGAASSLYLTSTIAHYALTTTSRDLRIYDYNDTTFPIWIRDGKVGLSNIAPSHAITVGGDISGSGKIFNMGGIETVGNLGVTGSIAAGNIMPRTDNVYNLGSDSLRWQNIYTGDLHLKNDRGDWTIVEEEEYLSVINNKTNKKYKMVLEEIED